MQETNEEVSYKTWDHGHTKLMTESTNLLPINSIRFGTADNEFQWNFVATGRLRNIYELSPNLTTVGLSSGTLAGAMKQGRRFSNAMNKRKRKNNDGKKKYK